MSKAEIKVRAAAKLHGFKIKTQDNEMWQSWLGHQFGCIFYYTDPSGFPTHSALFDDWNDALSVISNEDKIRFLKRAPLYAYYPPKPVP